MRTARNLGFFAGLATVFGVAAQQPRMVNVQLLAINDLHANLEPPSGSNGMVNRTPAGGIEYLATHIRNAMKESEFAAGWGWRSYGRFAVDLQPVS